MDDADWAAIETDLAHDPQSLPDGVIEGTDLAAWQVLLDLIRDRGWRSLLCLHPDEVRVPERAADLFAIAEDGSTLKVWIRDDLQVNVFLHQPESVDFDVSAREVLAVGVRVLGDLLRDLGQALERPVRLGFEGSMQIVILRYDPATDALSR